MELKQLAEHFKKKKKKKVVLEDFWTSEVTFPGQVYRVPEAKEENGMELQVLSNSWEKGRKTLESKCQVLENEDLQNRNQKNQILFPAYFQPQLCYNHFENKKIFKKRTA